MDFGFIINSSGGGNHNNVIDLSSLATQGGDWLWAWQARVLSGKMTEQDGTIIAALFAMLVTVSLLMKAFVLRIVDGYSSSKSKSNSYDNNDDTIAFTSQLKNIFFPASESKDFFVVHELEKSSSENGKIANGMNGRSTSSSSSSSSSTVKAEAAVYEKSFQASLNGRVPMSNGHHHHITANLQDFGESGDETATNSTTTSDSDSDSVDSLLVSSSSPANEEATRREEEFPTLAGGIAMLDAAGAPPPPKKLVEEYHTLILTSLLCNPHSYSQMVSQSTAPLELQFASKSIDEIRGCVLDFFDAPRADYDVIFTSGCTQAMQLLADCLPWQECIRKFIYSRDAHTSMIGIREAAMRSGMTSVYVAMERQKDQVNRYNAIAAKRNSNSNNSSSGGEIGKKTNNKSNESVDVDMYDTKQQWDVQQVHLGKTDGSDKPHRLGSEKPKRLGGQRFTLIGVTAECNFSGRRRTEKQIKQMSERNSKLLDEVDMGKTESVLVLLDGAKAAATTRLSMRKTNADFLGVSFYKIFGFPTGIGALIVSKRGLRLMEEGQHVNSTGFFGGGTVEGVSASDKFLVRKRGCAAFEHGTPNFQAIFCIPLGIKYIQDIGGLDVIQKKTAALATRLAVKLSKLRHPSGRKAVILYGPCSVSPEHSFYAALQGPTVSFNLIASDGNVIGFSSVVKVADLNGVVLRGGCHCNPGACEMYLGIQHSHKHKSGFHCGDGNDILDGKAMGCVRASMGWYSTYGDIDKLIDVIRKNFIQTSTTTTTTTKKKAKNITNEESVSSAYGFVSNIIVYPIKSCGGVEVIRWPLSESGKLLYDHEWALLDDEGNVLSQKRYPQLATITAFPDLEMEVLRISSSIYDSEELVIPLEEESLHEVTVKMFGRETLCTYHEFSHPSHSKWLERAVGKKCRLIRSVNSATLANNSELLVVNAESVEALRSRLKTRKSDEALKMADVLSFSQFRPNIVVSGFHPYKEDGWQSINLTNSDTGTSIQLTNCGPCARCTMINNNSDKSDTTTIEKGTRGREPLRTLAEYRLKHGEIHFGIRMRSMMVSNGSSYFDSHSETFVYSHWVEVDMHVMSL